MADEAKAAVACMAAWLRFVIDDLFENCLTHDALILHSPARSLEQKHEGDDRLKKGFRVVGIKFSWHGRILGLPLSFSSTFAIRAGLPTCRFQALRRDEATEGVAGGGCRCCYLLAADPANLCRESNLRTACKPTWRGALADQSPSCH